MAYSDSQLCQSFVSSVIKQVNNETYLFQNDLFSDSMVQLQMNRDQFRNVSNLDLVKLHQIGLDIQDLDLY